jgi:serine/threonine protein kinase
MSDTPFGLDDEAPTPRRSETTAGHHWPRLTIGDGLAVKIVGVKEGGMGKIFIGALEGDMTNKIAVKAFDDRWFFNAQVRQAFQREINVWLQLSDTPFIFSAIEVTNIKGIPHVVMPLVEPGDDGAVSAGDLVRAATGIGGGRVFEIALAAAMGLDAANTKVPGLIHGDIKPDNILLPKGVPHVSDFGLAQVLNSAQAADCPAGTPEYLAPEIWIGKARQVTGDIYAYGCMLYELLTGEPPYGRDRTKQRDAHCNAALPPAPPFVEATV